jgi:hypothetical protein
MSIDPFPTPLRMAADSGWLHRLIRQGAEARACMETGCTTCGATPFREALRREAFHAAGRVLQPRLDRAAARHLAVALANLHPDADAASAMEDPARVILQELRTSPLDQRAVAALLDGTWAGELGAPFAERDRRLGIRSEGPPCP